MIEFAVKYHNRLTDALWQHLEIVGLTLLISVVLASALTVLVMSNKTAANLLVRLFGAIYSIPSLALFAILVPFLGIGLKPAVFVLVVYNQFLLLRNFLAGLDSVDPAIIEAAVGMGMTPIEVLGRIKLPLAFPVILAGIHLAIISTIGIATIAAAINAGGIGAILFDGMRTMNTVKIVWGTILAGGLAISANLLLNALEKVAARKFRYHELVRSDERS